MSVRWLDQVMKSPALREQIERGASGTSPTMKNISKKKVMSLLLPPHSTREQNRALTHLDSLRPQVAALRKLHSETASELDALLPSIVDKALKHLEDSFEHDSRRILSAFPLRAANLVWLLGAGASAASGIPTAGYMIWDFKRRVYCAEQGISLRSCEDLTDPMQSKIQRYLDGRGDCPVVESDEEYSHYFSMTFPDEADRRRYIDEMISKATPSFGFLVLAVLMKLRKARAFWTTNLIEISKMLWR